MSQVAVIVPVHNRSDLLKRAMGSIITQSRTAHEVVIVDDGSTEDLTPVRRIAREQGWKWISLPENLGPAAARNRGVEATTAEWISFLDSDDEWHPEKLARQIGWHGTHPQYRISQVGELWNRKGEIVKKPGPWQQREGDLFADSVERCSIGPSCVMIARSLWEETGGFDERFRVCEDYELWLRITAQERIGLVPGPDLVVKHAGHDEQLSTLVPAMDRFRVVALLEHFFEERFDPGQRVLMANGIRTKSGILAAGARKRGNLPRAAFYEELSELNLETLSESAALLWIARAWAQIEEGRSSESERES